MSGHLSEQTELLASVGQLWVGNVPNINLARLVSDFFPSRNFASRSQEFIEELFAVSVKWLLGHTNRKQNASPIASLYQGCSNGNSARVVWVSRSIALAASLAGSIGLARHLLPRGRATLSQAPKIWPPAAGIPRKPGRFRFLVGNIPAPVAKMLAPAGVGEPNPHTGGC